MSTQTPKDQALDATGDLKRSPVGVKTPQLGLLSRDDRGRFLTNVRPSLESVGNIPCCPRETSL